MTKMTTNNYKEWIKLGRSLDGLHELWKTPTRYLICSKYAKQYIYFKSKYEAINEFSKYYK